MDANDNFGLTQSDDKSASSQTFTTLAWACLVAIRALVMVLVIVLVAVRRHSTR